MKRRAFFQEQGQSTRREVGAVTKVQSVGGRVQKISAADDSQEVSFYLAGEKVNDTHIENLSAIGNVIWLNLANTKITDDGLKHLAGMKLKKLHLEKTQIGDEGLAHLKDQVELEYLNLYGTKVTDKGLVHLHGLKKLKRLYVWQSQVTPEGMKKLEKMVEGLQVVGECKLPVIKKEEKKKDAKKKDAKKKKAQKGKDKKSEPKKDKKEPVKADAKPAQKSDEKSESKPAKKPAAEEKE